MGLPHAQPSQASHFQQGWFWGLGNASCGPVLWGGRVFCSKCPWPLCCPCCPFSRWTVTTRRLQMCSMKLQRKEQQLPPQTENLVLHFEYILKIIILNEISSNDKIKRMGNKSYLPRLSNNYEYFGNLSSVFSHDVICCFFCIYHYLPNV